MSIVRRGDDDICTRYRPMRLSEVAGNDSAVKALGKALSLGDSRPKTYMFFGPPGTGKTTTARIMAMGLNCEKGDTGEPCLECSSCKQAMSGNAMHITEMNLAKYSNKGDAFELSESMHLCSLTGRNKIFIFDEAQKMNKAAQELLLKPLEEPPPNTYIFICTTEPSSVIKAMHSRCEKHEFKLPSKAYVVDTLKSVFSQEPDWAGKMNDDDKVKFLEAMEGKSIREVLRAIDQVVRGGIGVLSSIVSNDAELIDVCRRIMAGDFNGCMEALNKMEGGVDCEGFRLLAVAYFNSILVKCGMKDIVKGAMACDVMDCFMQPYYDSNPRPRLNRDIFKACVTVKSA